MQQSYMAMAPFMRHKFYKLDEETSNYKLWQLATTHLRIPSGIRREATRILESRGTPDPEE